ncbi:ADP-ribosylation factor-like protein 2-binding protein isoform X1 [Ostrea edulis]|uniref:ADP-ribosylation factor-like protein 2-binding protein isoform X1 n=1 Tax=Ostrea edulis TaxID=37623 RepID=UPI002094C845|nr:ADP-ribosylation factor-like protein 2-binding protein isoform X1 [Ostrea edulis]
MASNADNAGDEKPDGIEAMEFAFAEEDLAISSSNAIDTKFDEAVGHIEDIIMEDEFQTLQNNFMEKYYLEFEDTEENKFCYTDIHREYIELIEKYLEEELSKRIENFSMGEFTKVIMERKNELEGEIFEMLLTFSDFVAFKEMFLDYRAEKEGRNVDLSMGITVTSLQGGPDDEDDDMEDHDMHFPGGLSLTGHSFAPHH